MSKTPRDRAEVESLIARHYQGLRLLILRRAGDAALGNDLLHEAICTTWEKWQAGKIARPEQIAGYVFRVALNHLRNERGKMVNRPDKRAAPTVLDDVAAPPAADAVAEAGIAKRVAAFVDELARPLDRLLVRRFYLDEESKESICRDLQLQPLEFDKAIFRARRRLRRLIEARGLGSRDFYFLACLA